MQTQTSSTLHNAIMEAGGKDRPPMLAPGIDNDIYSTIDACPNACEMWKSIERLKQGESINVQDLESNLYWEFGKFTSRDGESLESYYSRFYKMMNELVRNQCDVTNHHVNVQFLLQLQPKWQRNRGKAIVNSPQPIYDEEPYMVTEDDEMSKDKEIDKIIALISLSFKKIYKPTNNNFRTSSNTSRANQDNSPRINRSDGYDNQRLGNVAGARETVAYHREKMVLCKQEETGIQLNAEQADWRDDTDDESKDQELEAHYMYMVQIQEVSLVAVNSRPIFDTETMQKNDDDDDLANEREIEDLKTKNKSLKSSNNRFKEANNKLSETNALMYNNLKKFKAELDKRNDVEYASTVEIDCAKAKGDLISYKMESQKSFNKYTQTINDLNQTISEMKKKLSAHQETISILSHAKEAQIKLYKTRKDKELDKVIALENKVKGLDNIVYKTSQSVQTMNMLNSKCRTSFAKPEFLKKAQRANPRCHNDNLALMLAPESDEVIRLEKEKKFHLCLKEEMVADLRYFNSLELGVDSLKSQLKTQKTQFLNEIDRLSREYYYADHMNAILGVYTELDEDLKAQLQDKGIAISELKKLIEKLKEKSVDTKFEKSSVIREPNAFKSQRPLILGKPTIFSDFLERKDFSKSKSVTKISVSNDFSKPVTAQIFPSNQKSILKNTNVLAPGMYKLHIEPTQTRTSQLPHDSRKTNKHVSFSTGVIPTTSVSRP
nr:hypothetical protein [Tanacetum cinerariifolium]